MREFGAWVLVALSGAGAWMSENWLGLATFAAAAFGAGVGWRQFQLTRRDVSLFVTWDGGEPSFEQEGSEAEPVKLELIALNTGGSRSPKGRLTVSLPVLWRPVRSDGWEPDTPNALLPPGCEARACDIPRLARSERRSLPPLSVVPRNQGVDGGRWVVKGRLIWDAWIEGRHAGSNELKFKLELRRL